MARLSSMGLELEEIAEDGEVTLAALAELAEDRGRPASHYLAAIPLATELKVAARPGATIAVRVCAGNCQRYGALDLLDHLIGKAKASITPVECLDRCDNAPAAELASSSGTLVLAPATASAIDEALDNL